MRSRFRYLDQGQCSWIRDWWRAMQPPTTEDKDVPFDLRALGRADRAKCKRCTSLEELELELAPNLLAAHFAAPAQEQETWLQKCLQGNYDALFLLAGVLVHVTDDLHENPKLAGRSLVFCLGNAQLKAGYTSLTTAFNSGSLSTTLIPGSGGGVLGPLNEGTYALSIVQPYTYGSNSNYTFSIYDPAPTISSVTAVLNNTSQACTANLNCQLVINGSGLVYGTTYTIIETGTTLVKSVYPATPVPWTTVTTSAFSVATAGTYTYALTCGGVESGFATVNVQ